MFGKKFWTEGTGSLIIAVAIALTIRWAFMEAYVIPSGSMLPSLLIHDHIFVNKFVYGIRVPFTEKWMIERNNPEKGEVIVFKYPQDMSMFYIKRVVGLPGDKIYYENGDLYINDKLVERTIPQTLADEFELLRDEDFRQEGIGARNNYVHWEETLGDYRYSVLLRKRGRPRAVFGPWTVPEDSYFVMGDNRDNSLDSRFWAPEKRFVPRSYLVGRAMFVWLSCNETISFLPFLCNPLEIRGGRFFHQVHHGRND